VQLPELTFRNINSDITAFIGVIAGIIYADKHVKKSIIRLKTRLTITRATACITQSRHKLLLSD